MKVFLDELGVNELFRHGGHIITSDGKCYDNVHDFDDNVEYADYYSKISSAYIGDSEYHYDAFLEEFIYCGSKAINGLRSTDPYGIKNVNFTCIVPDDERWDDFKEQRLKDGFDESELWGLNNTIASYIIPRLKSFAEATQCVPSDMGSLNEWKKTLGAIIEGFESHLDKRPYDKKKIDKALRLFAKHFKDLWC